MPALLKLNHFGRLHSCGIHLHSTKHEKENKLLQHLTSWFGETKRSFHMWAPILCWIYEIWRMQDLAFCVLSLRFVALKCSGSEILNENKLDKTSHFPSLRMFFFLIPRNVCRAVSSYFTNRKDDTRVNCNYVQRYRFSPVFTCKTSAISFGI